MRETRRLTPAIEGRLSRRRAVPPLCKRKALSSAALLPGNGASNLKRKVVRRSSERQGGLSTCGYRGSGTVGFGLGGWG